MDSTGGSRTEKSPGIEPQRRGSPARGEEGQTKVNGPPSVVLATNIVIMPLTGCVCLWGMGMGCKILCKIRVKIRVQE